MTRRFAHAILLGLTVVALADAQAPPVRVLASNGVRAVLKDLIPQCERAVGRPLAVEFALSASIKRRIEDNESFDVTILASDVIDALIKEVRRRLLEGSRLLLDEMVHQVTGARVVSHVDQNFNNGDFSAPGGV